MFSRRFPLLVTHDLIVVSEISILVLNPTQITIRSVNGDTSHLLERGTPERQNLNVQKN